MKFHFQPTSSYMFLHTKQDQSPLDHSGMFVDDQNSADGQPQHPSPRNLPHQQSFPQNSATFPLDKPVTSAIRDPTFFVPSVDTQDAPLNPTTGHAPSSTQRPSQNRAAFGKWKSKPISGFPAADTHLPRGITAQQVCESFPNHVDDHVILALMREGKGAKAIDALIPAQPGKPKAGQSHSKIQLRISTIREAFSDEDFPITSTKRNRASSEGSKVEALNSERGDALSMTTPRLSSSSHAITEAARSANLRGEKRKHTDVDGFPIGNHFGKLARASSDLAKSAPSHWSPSMGAGQSARGLAASSISQPPNAAPLLFQSSPLQAQIRRENQKHQQLVFDIFYGNQPFSQMEMAQTIVAHCAETYDSFSLALQVKSGSMLEKSFLPSGYSENSLSYLQRSITQCFERLPEFRARVNFDCPVDQIGTRFETAILQDLLGRLHGWTKLLEAKLEILRQIRAHKDLHERAARNVEVFQTKHYPESTPSGSHPGRTTYSSTIDPRLMEMSNELKGFEGTRPFETSANSTLLQHDKHDISDHSSGHLPETDSLPHQADRHTVRSHPTGPFVKSVSPVELSDHSMTDTPNVMPKNPRHEFELYMDEAGEFVEYESRAMDLPEVSGKLEPQPFDVVYQSCFLFLQVYFRLSPRRTATVY